MQQNVNQQIGMEGDEDFAAMFEASLKERGGEGLLKEGEIVKGTVVQVTKDYAVVDIGYKSEGQIPISEFTNATRRSHRQGGRPRRGAPREPRERHRHGRPLQGEGRQDAHLGRDLRRLRARRDRQGHHRRPREGRPLRRHRRQGVPPRLARSTSARCATSTSSSAKEFEFKVIKFNKKRGNIVLSRRVLLEKQREEMKKETLKNLKEGAVLKGVVKNLTDYGAFIDLGGIDGLLHITDMSWGRIGHPSEMFNVGDEVHVVVLKFDPAHERVTLGLKQIQEDPWHRADEKYPVGTRVKGKVVSASPTTARSSRSSRASKAWSTSPRCPGPSASSTRRKILEVGDEVEAVVLDIDPKAKRIALGMKQIEQNPWTLLEDKYPIGSVIKGQVRNVTDFGVFVGVEEGIDGLVHVSDISWTQRIKHPGELYKKGDEVEAVVLNIDVENERFSLGIKQLQPDPWDTLPERTPVGSRVKGKVTKVTDFGAFVEIEPGIEGLVHVSELKEERVENPRDVVKEGQEVDVKIIDINTQDRKVALSMKAAARTRARTTTASTSAARPRAPRRASAT